MWKCLHFTGVQCTWKDDSVVVIFGCKLLTAVTSRFATLTTANTKITWQCSIMWLIQNFSRYLLHIRCHSENIFRNIYKKNITYIFFNFLYIYSTASAEPSFEHPSPRFTLTCSLKKTTAIGVFCRYFGWSPAFNCPRQWTPRDAVYEHRGSRWPDTVLPGVLSLILNKLHVHYVDDEKPLTAMIHRVRPLRILAFGHRETRGSWPPGSTGVRPRCSTARG